MFNWIYILWNICWNCCQWNEKYLYLWYLCIYLYVFCASVRLWHLIWKLCNLIEKFLLTFQNELRFKFAIPSDFCSWGFRVKMLHWLKFFRTTNFFIGKLTTFIKWTLNKFIFIFVEEKPTKMSKLVYRYIP